MSEMKKIKNLKEFSTSADRFEGANLLCPGCAHSIIVREVLNATNDDLVLAASTVQVVLKFVLLFIHIHLGMLLGFISDLKTHQLQLQVLRLCINL